MPRRGCPTSHDAVQPRHEPEDAARATEPGGTTRTPDRAPLLEELATLRQNTALRLENATLHAGSAVLHERVHELEAGLGQNSTNSSSSRPPSSDPPQGWRPVASKDDRCWTSSWRRARRRSGEPPRRRCLLPDRVGERVPFMYGVGVVEIVAGILVGIWPYIFAYGMMRWL
jgi:hypothetical protein